MRSILSITALMSLLLLAGCGSKQKPVREAAAGANRVEISFTSPAEGPDMTDLIMVFDNPTQIDTLLDLTTEANTEAFKCGYDCKISYFKDDELVLEADVNLGEDCQHAAYMVDGEANFRQLNPTAIELLHTAMTATVDKAKTLESFAQLSWIEGKWIDDRGTVKMYEFWRKESPLSYIGETYAELKNGKRMAETTFRLELSNNKPVYLSTVKTGGVWQYNVTAMNGTELNMEQSEGKYPQSIIHLPAENGGMYEVIEGTENGREITIEYNFVRMEE